jgi:hypothetical protein
VTQPAVSADLLKTFNVITEFGINILGEYLVVLSSLEILLSVQEPEWDLELTGVLDDSNELFNLIGRELSSSLVDINFGLFADKISESSPKTLDFCQTENNISLSRNVGIQNTKNVLKLSTLHQ